MLSPKKLSPVNVTVRIDTSQQGNLSGVVQALQVAGLAKLQRHDRFMIVNGCVAPNKLEALREVVGVASVRPDQAYKPQ